MDSLRLFEAIETLLKCTSCMQKVKNPYIDSSSICCYNCITQSRRLQGQGTQFSRLQAILDLNLQRSDFEKNISSETSCNALKSLGFAKELVNYFESVEKDPTSFIYEYFANVKNEVDLTRETLKLRIDEFYNKLITEIETYQKECNANAKSRKTGTSLKDLKAKVKQWEEDTESLCFNESVYVSIIENSANLEAEIREKMNEIKQSIDELLLNKSKEFEKKFSNVKELFCQELQFNT